MLSFDLLDAKIDTLLHDGALTRYTNEFFTSSRSMSNIFRLNNHIGIFFVNA